MLVTLDTTRADHLGAYGGPRTPFLDALAARGARFARCDTAAPLSVPAHATILTGLYPLRHGVRDNSGFVLGDAPPTLASLAAAAGRDTAAVVSSVVLRRQTGLARGFAVYDDDLGAGFAERTALAEQRAETTTDEALALLRTLKPPYLLWVHYFDPHDEYRPPPPFAEHGAPYDGEIAYMDAQLGRLLAALPAETLVAVVGDHGEMLGEHGEDTHGLLPYAGARRVPLLLAGPGVPRTVVPSLVRTADLMPTLLQLSGLPVPAGLDGASLVPLLSGEREPPRLSYSEAFEPFLGFGWFPLRTLSDGDTLFVHAPSPSLYDLGVDHEEKTDLAAARRADVARWQQKLGALLEAAGEALEGSVATAPPDDRREGLASLGYVQSAGGRIDRTLPDPRARVAAAREIRTAVEAAARGRCTEALPRLEALSRENPRSVDLLEMAGVCHARGGDLARAVAAFRAVVRGVPGRAGPRAHLARALLGLERRAEAEASAREALQLDAAEGEAAGVLADVLLRAGLPADAEQVLTRAIEAGAARGELFLARAFVRERQGKDAVPDLREAARRRPADPVPLERLGAALLTRGETRAAATAYEQLARLQPGRPDIWMTLARLYADKLGDRAAAARSVRSALRLQTDPVQRVRLEALLADLER